MKRLDWFIARRYLASRHKGRFLSLITVIAVGGVFLGVMALITVIGVMTGLQRDLQDKIIGNNPHIYVFEMGGQGFRLHNYRAVMDSLRTVPGIVAQQPFIMTEVGLVANDLARTGTLYGIRIDSTYPPISEIEARIRAGELKLGPTRSGHPGIIIGNRLAEGLSAGTGDVVTIVALETLKPAGLGDIAYTQVEFEITGIFHSGMFEYDSKYMYTDLAPAQTLLALDSTTVSGIAVNVPDPWKVEPTRDAVEARIGPRYITNQWKELSGDLFGALKLEKLAMSVILFLIVLVAAFNIISTLIMVVADKTREIGILKSMGLTDGTVLRIFVLQGITIGVIGTVLGTAGGLILVGLLHRYKFIDLPGDVYFIDKLPVALNPADVALIILISLLIAFAATIYPARQASQLLPVEAIRHD